MVNGHVKEMPQLLASTKNDYHDVTAKTEKEQSVALFFAVIYITAVLKINSSQKQQTWRKTVI
jgi:hypothetical protein